MIVEHNKCNECNSLQEQVSRLHDLIRELHRENNKLAYDLNKSISDLRTLREANQALVQENFELKETDKTVLL